MRKQVIGCIALFALYWITTPLQHMLLLLFFGVGSWLKWPKQSLVTSYLVCSLLVLFGHLSIGTSAILLSSHPVAILVVGCLLAQVLVKNNLHLVLSEFLMAKFKPRTEYGIVLMMLLISSFLSMWMSNTSVVAMLIPVVTSLSESLEVKLSRLLLTIAYGATIGGMLTPIGTPANLVAIGYAERYFGIAIDFATWVSYALPFVSMLLVGLSAYLFLVSNKKPIEYDATVNSVTDSQKQVMLLLGICALLWATQSIPFGGWKGIIGYSVGEEWIGMAILLLISTRYYNGTKAFSLSDIRTLPYSSIWMVIAGMFMAEGMVQYRVIPMMMDYLSTGGVLHSYQTFLLFGFLMSSVTEVCSNTAVTSLGLPLSDMMMRLSHMDALSCILLITFSANSAFMLPTATPPNALVLGTGKLSSKQLVLTGLYISALSLAVLVLFLTII